jgi:hypothetical protein
MVILLERHIVDAGPSALCLLYHIRSGLSVVEVRLSLWRILDSFCGDYATSPVSSVIGNVMRTNSALVV